MKASILFLFALFTLPALASDGPSDSGTDNGVIEFLKQPRVPNGENGQPLDSSDYEFQNQPVKYWTRGAGKPTMLTCAQYQSRSPFAFHASCGHAAKSVQNYVRSRDVRYCYVGVSCVPHVSGR